MRDSIRHIYAVTGSVVFSVFLLAFFAYLVFMVASYVRVAFTHKQDVSKADIDSDVNEQW